FLSSPFSCKYQFSYMAAAQYFWLLLISDSLTIMEISGHHNRQFIRVLEPVVRKPVMVVLYK
ncbi:hypothetical protein CA599_27830, partial [Paenibacillus taichungensis]